MASSQWFDRFVSFLSFVSSSESDSAHTRVGHSRLCLESLEDRAVPAIFTVTNLNDAGAGSLRAAITEANAAPDADVIQFQSGLTGTINLNTVGDTTIGNAAFGISSAITIDGSNGADGITIARDSNAASMRLFNISTSGNLSLQGVSLSGGKVEGTAKGLPVVGDADAKGGAVYNQGTLFVSKSLFTANTVKGGMGAEVTTQEEEASTQEVGNTAGNGGDGFGGAIFNDGGTVVIRNSTLSGNKAEGGDATSGDLGKGMGGAIFNLNGSLTISNSTLTNNTAPDGGRGVYNLADGETANAKIDSTIIGQSDATITDFVGEAKNGGINETSGSNNLIRQAIGYSGNVTSTLDPLLEALKDNGGPTMTHTPQSGSPVIDSGSNVNNQSTDQRGGNFNRNVGTPDIGSVEFNATSNPVPMPTPTPNLTMLPPTYAVGAGKGGTPHVKVLNYDGSEKLSILAYDEFFTGGVNVAQGDVNKDGIKDLITAPLSGGSPHIKVFDGKTGALIHSFYAYDESLSTGVNIASGDVNKDGYDDIVTVPKAGAVSHVRVFDGRTGDQIQNFYAYDPSFTGGSSIAVGDHNKDGYADIITGAGVGGTPHVRGFSGQNSQELFSFFANQYFGSNGVTVTSGDINGDGQRDILTTAMSGNSSMVDVRDGKTMRTNNLFFALGQGSTGTTTLSTRDINGDGKAEVIVGAASGTTPKIKVLNPATNFSEMQVLLAYNTSFLGGVIVG